jgi:hypothetical protein
MIGMKSAKVVEDEDLDDVDVLKEEKDENKKRQSDSEEEEVEELGENEYADINMELLRALGIVGSNMQPSRKKPGPAKKKRVEKPRDPSVAVRRTPRAVAQRNLSDMALSKFCAHCGVQGHSQRSCLAAQLSEASLCVSVVLCCFALLCFALVWGFCLFCFGFI